MSMKPVRKAALYVVSVVLTYLVVAALWAWAVVDEEVASYRVGPTAALDRNQMKILFAIEDPTFLHHKGLSLANGQGKATITSAVTANALLFRRDMPGIKGGFQALYRAVFSCCKQIDLGRDVMTLVVNAKVPKEKQLAMYAADVYMGTANGQQIRGFDAAALAYMQTPLAKLTNTQFAALVAMIKAPNTYHPTRNRAAYQQRVQRVNAVVTGSCQPDGLFDTTYAHCAP